MSGYLIASRIPPGQVLRGVSGKLMPDGRPLVSLVRPLGGPGAPSKINPRRGQNRAPRDQNGVLKASEGLLGARFAAVCPRWPPRPL